MNAADIFIVSFPPYQAGDAEQACLIPPQAKIHVLPGLVHMLQNLLFKELTGTGDQKKIVFRHDSSLMII